MRFNCGKNKYCISPAARLNSTTVCKLTLNFITFQAPNKRLRRNINFDKNYKIHGSTKKWIQSLEKETYLDTMFCVKDQLRRVTKSEQRDIRNFKKPWFVSSTTLLKLFLKKNCHLSYKRQFKTMKNILI